METRSEIPGERHVPEINTTVPHSARIWNYWLGGKDNYPVDREAGEAFRRLYPGIVDVARESRYLLARFVRYLTREAGIRQFLDIGTGLPAVDNTTARPARGPRRPGRLRRQRPAGARPRPRPAHRRPAGQHRVPPRRPARARPHPRGRGADPRLRPADRPHAHGRARPHHRLRPRPRPGAAARRRPAARQPPRPLRRPSTATTAPGPRSRTTGTAAPSPTTCAPARRSSASSTASSSCHPGWCRSRVAARPAPARRAEGERHRRHRPQALTGP